LHFAVQASNAQTILQMSEVSARWDSNTHSLHAG